MSRGGASKRVSTTLSSSKNGGTGRGEIFCIMGLAAAMMAKQE